MFHRFAICLMLMLFTFGLGACSKSDSPDSSSSSTPSKSGSDLSGAIAIDGSSTVYPITEAVAEEFNKVHPKIRVTVGISGTGGGFKRFATGETDISDASPPSKTRNTPRQNPQKLNSLNCLWLMTACLLSSTRKTPGPKR